jgi:uncharacterized protein YecE (DUF72 family)
VRLLVGSSGYSFKEWKGPFYPEDLKDDGFLGHYAARLPTVEINNTFYRLPKESVLREWASQVPDGFLFTLKASQRITHFARLKAEATDPLSFLLKNVEVMGEKLGVILFQLPPNLQKDLARLQAFLALLPHGRRYAFEFRHPSWFGDDVVAELRAHDAAMVVIEQEGFSSPMIPTARWGYLRLHRFDYDERALETWMRRIQDEPWEEAFVFFKHDVHPGSGPAAIAAFRQLLTDATHG